MAVRKEFCLEPKLFVQLDWQGEKKNPKESKHIFPLSWPAKQGTKLASTASSSNCMQLGAACLGLLVEEPRTELGTPLWCRTVICLMLTLTYLLC